MPELRPGLVVAAVVVVRELDVVALAVVGQELVLHVGLELDVDGNGGGVRLAAVRGCPTVVGNEVEEVSKPCDASLRSLAIFREK